MEKKIFSLSSDEKSAQASKLSGFLRSKIKGQDPVINNFIKYLEGFISGLRRQDKPVYRGLFLGLPNVGKKLFIESLAEALFGNKDYYSEISCGAFNLETVSAVPAMLVRAEIDLPALLKDEGYIRIFDGQRKLHNRLVKLQSDLFNLCMQVNKDNVNSEELNLKIGDVTKTCINLSKAINLLEERMNTYRSNSTLSIVVFSDFERSCPGMLNIIHRVLRDGCVRFENGEEVDLTNSIVIVTSTIISDVIMEEINKLKKDELGFKPPNKEQIEKMDKAIYDRLADTKKIYRSSMEFAIENLNLSFLSSFDRISIFRPLFEDALKDIFDLELKKFYTELFNISFSISLKISKEVKNFIVRESLDRPEFGASRLLAKFDKYIRREVARLKNRNEIKAGDILYVIIKDNSVVFSKESEERAVE